MSAYLIKLPDGTELGPFDEATVSEMRVAGDITDGDCIIPLSEGKDAQLNVYLLQLIERGTRWENLDSPTRSELLLHRGNLIRKIPSVDDIHIRNLALIDSIPGIEMWLKLLREAEELQVRETSLTASRRIHTLLESMSAALNKMNAILAHQAGLQQQAVAIAAAPKYGIAITQEL